MSELMVDEIHEEKRIKVRSAEIVVHGTLEKPYYEIKYQTTDGEWHIGYSSRKLEMVFNWLNECFEIVSYEKEIRDKAIADYQKGYAKFFLNKRNEFVNEIQRRANDRIREAIVAETRTVSCYKTGIKEGLEEAVKVLDEIAEQMEEVGE